MKPLGLRAGPDLGLRISLSVAALLTALTVCLGALAVQAQRSLLLYHAQDAGQVVAALVSQGARLALFAEDRAGLRRELAEALLHDYVLEACALDRSGGLLARVGRAEAAEAACGLGPKPASVLDPPERPGRLEGPDSFTFWAPVLTAVPPGSEDALYYPPEPEPPGAVVGYAAVRFSKAPVREGMHQILVRTALAGIVFLLLGAAVAHRLIRAATRPLRELTETVRARGVPVSEPRDDVSLLRGAYSGLVESLDRAFGDLQSLRQDLEQRVEARTAELREARDRLEERVAERTAQLEETYRQLVHAEKLSATGRLAASVAHEFNNPVFGIRNVLRGLLASPALGTEDRELAEMAVAECDRLRRLVRDLQSFSRPSSGRAEPVDLRRAVDAMVLLCAKEFGRKKIAVEVDFAHDVPPVRGVEDQLKQVVLNLLTNAGDAVGDEGGTVRVRAERRGAEVALRVEDTGRGILPEHRERIFDPFFTTKPAVKGTGLGLSVSYGIVRRHGGRIEVASEPGRGAAFTVTLPIEGASQP
ncbi:MAG: ATP-binding protein [Thermodesulfobacteriota bacterium]